MGPFYAILFLSIDKPFAPSTYSIVFVASTGKSKILKQLAVADAPIVFTITGKFFVFSDLFISDKNNVFENVSPNLDIGPYIIATGYPR